MQSKSERLVLICIGVFLASSAILSLLAERFYYQNYWGGMVFAPYTALIGFLIVIVGFLRRGRTHKG